MSEQCDLSAEGPEILARAGVEATLAHIRLLRRKREQLLAAQVEAERQLLHRLSVAYDDGRVSEIELAIAYRAHVEVAGPGSAGRWNTSGLPRSGRLQGLLRYRRLYVPEADGTWRGPWPRDGHTVPPKGTCVVYVLYDGANEPCYVGSTQNLKARLMSHAKEKEFSYWTAFACDDREAAYRLEEKLLSEAQPYLNKKRTR